MQKLLELFMHAPANDHQATFLDHEAELLIHNCSYSYNQSKMRGAIIDWVNEQVNEAGFEITQGTSGFTVTFNDQESDYSWSETDELCRLIETIKENS